LQFLQCKHSFKISLYWLVHNSDAYIQQGTNLDALDMHISNKKFSSLVLEFETIEDPNKHTQIDEKDKSTTWPLYLVFSFYTLKYIPGIDNTVAFRGEGQTSIQCVGRCIYNTIFMAPDSTRREYTLTNSVFITGWVSFDTHCRKSAHI
jgi:hypothetical protein